MPRWVYPLVFRVLALVMRLRHVLLRENTLNILIFHRVMASKDPLRPWEPDVQEFDRKLQLLSRYFAAFTVKEGLKKLGQNTLPAGAVSITFDDGYLDNLTLAAPLLNKWGLPATVYIATGFSNGETMWNDIVIDSIAHFSGDELDLTAFGLGCHRAVDDQDKRQLIGQILPILKYWPIEKRLHACQGIAVLCGFQPEPLMMNNEQIRALVAQGVEIGAHTVNHPILKELAADEQLQEMARSKQTLESLLGESVVGFAYPNGAFNQDYDEQSVRCVQSAGFHYAVTTDSGFCTQKSGLHELPRYSPWDTQPERFCLRLMLKFCFGKHG